MNTPFTPYRKAGKENFLNKAFHSPGKWLAALLIVNILALAIVFVQHEKKTRKETASSGFTAKNGFFMGCSYRSDHVVDTLDLSEHKAIFNAGKNGMYGIDVSTWQKYINWKELCKDSKGKVDFAIVKSTEGSRGIDPLFVQNWKNARDNVSFLGAYHFYLYNEDPVLQAENYIRNTPLVSGNFRPIVDVELACNACNTSSVAKDTFVCNLGKFLAALEQHYETKPVLYSSTWFSQTFLYGFFSGYPFWTAQFSVVPPPGFRVQSSAQVSPRICVWQFTSRGRLPGITDYVDLDFMHAGDLEYLLLK